MNFIKVLTTYANGHILTDENFTVEFPSAGTLTGNGIESDGITITKNYVVDDTELEDFLNLLKSMASLENKTSVKISGTRSGSPMWSVSATFTGLQNSPAPKNPTEWHNYYI